MSQLFKLTTTVTFRGPSWVELHTRYAILGPGRAITLPPGSWLLAQPQVLENEFLYRLPDGRLVALDRPLGEDEATPLDNPQALAAMGAYRPLEQAAWEEWGVKLEHVDRQAPFKLIKCRSPKLTQLRQGPPGVRFLLPRQPPSRRNELRHLHRRYFPGNSR
ncbi:MAG: hypothetical protein L0332_32975 [Chloroflexi bacterium]|nr:hypothetical protein [Chloroflexota bacterium]